MPLTTPQYRQFTRSHYHASSEREGGVAHLWHVARLAHIQLSNEERVVDTRAAADADDTRKDYAAYRRDRERRLRDAAVATENRAVLARIVSASTGKDRAARNLCFFPAAAAADPAGAAAVASRRAEDRGACRDRAARVRDREVARQNHRLLGHLVAAKPGVRMTARQLDNWYNTVHKKRLQQLSRFRPAEAFAGSRILEKECGVRIGGGKKKAKSTHGRGGNGDDHEDEADGDVGTAQRFRSLRHPVIAGRPLPPRDLGERLAAVRLPKALLPAMQSTSYGGFPLVYNDDDDEDDEEDGDGGRNRNGHTRSIAPGPHWQRRPEWQTLAATDIPILHYAADRLLHDNSSSGGGGLRTVRVARPDEEGGCTRLWRSRVTGERVRSERQRVRGRIACSALARASLTPREIALLEGVGVGVGEGGAGGRRPLSARQQQWERRFTSGRYGSGTAADSAYPPQLVPPPPPPQQQQQPPPPFTAAPAPVVGVFASSLLVPHPPPPREGRAAAPWTPAATPPPAAAATFPSSTPPLPSTAAAAADEAEAGLTLEAAVAASVCDQWLLASGDGPYVAL